VKTPAVVVGNWKSGDRWLAGILLGAVARVVSTPDTRAVGNVLLCEPLDGAGKHFSGMRGCDPARSGAPAAHACAVGWRSVTWPAVSPSKYFPIWRVRRAARKVRCRSTFPPARVSMGQPAGDLVGRRRGRIGPGPACARPTRGSWKSFAAIHPIDFRPCVRVVRDRSDNLSRRHMSRRARS